MNINSPPVSSKSPLSFRKKMSKRRSDMSESPSPQKRRRVINQLDSPPPREKTAEDYIERLAWSTRVNKKFNQVQFDSKFMIKDVPEDPEGLLRGIFQYCFDTGMEECRKNGKQPETVGCIISSTLLDPDIYVPFRPATENTVDSILNMFLLVAQSKKQNNITLWGEPFSVKITCLEKSTLPEKRKIAGGARRKLAPVHHQICDKSLIKINNEGNKHCLFQAIQATLVHHIGELTRDEFLVYMTGNRVRIGNVRDDAIKLMTDAGIPLDLDEYDAETFLGPVIDMLNDKYHGRHIFKCLIFGELGDYKPLIRYGPDNYDVAIFLLFNNKHFDGVRKQANIFKHRQYCASCETAYDKDSEHSMKCKRRCKKCSNTKNGGPCERDENYGRKCLQCNKFFGRRECYDHHLRTNFCNESKQCEKCGVIWRKVTKSTTHKCGVTYCYQCNDYHASDRGCFIKPLQHREHRAARYIAFDIETMFDDQPTDSRGRTAHEPNFVAAKVACKKCIDNGQWEKSLLPNENNIEGLLNNEPEGCAVCGHHRTITFGHRPFWHTQVDAAKDTPHPMRDFVTWLLEYLPEEYDSYVFSHFGGRFDMIYVFRELFRRRLNPSMLRKGNKLYEMRVKGPKGNTIIFRDSFNLLVMPLAQLVPSFALNVEEKPFFPYKANKPRNYGVRFAQLPPKEDYLYNGFMPKKKKAFEKWHEEHRNDGFFLDEALASYCTNDTDILMAALVAFRKEFMDITKRLPDENNEVNREAFKIPHNGIDPLPECMTIASASMKHFRMNHLKFNHLALIPERSYQMEDHQSMLGKKFLQWYRQKDGRDVRYCHSADCEKYIGEYKMDGWIEEEQKVIEVHGCAFHGCADCFPDNSTMLPTGKTAGWQRMRDKERLAFICKHPEVKKLEVYWECEIKRMLAADPEMRKCFDNYIDEGPLDIRSCFYGGRTAPLKLFHAVQPGEKISYYDVTSLYPYTNCFVDEDFLGYGYPIGHPKVHVVNKAVNWTKPEDNPYRLALLKCIIVPPRHIDVPVLPMKTGIDERLLFPLCITCAKQFLEGHVDLEAEYECRHSDQERGWITHCTSMELNAALKEGYQVSRVIRVIEWAEADEKLFRAYMQEFLAEKFHASGWDDSMKDDPEAQKKFMQECKDRFGIIIDPSKMKLNPGRRALAKLLVNNLWGRFSLRNFGLWQTKLTSDPAELREYLDKHDIDVMAIDDITDDGEVIMISYLKKKDYVDLNEASNVVISLWTTSIARLMLLRLMQKVARTEGCRILYTDTDSLIFCHKEDKCPLELSPHLGGLTAEYSDSRILEFCSSGAKAYGLKLQRHGAPEGDYDYVLKIRGMTLNEDVMRNQGLRYEKFKERVINFATKGEIDPIKIVYPNFLRPSIKDGVVYSQKLEKNFKPVVSKGVVRPNFDVLDYGFIPN